jgi:hypothetical protein
VRLGPLEPLAAEKQVYLFVVEGHQSCDGLELAGREVVGTRQIGVTVSPTRTDQYPLVPGVLLADGGKTAAVRALMQRGSFAGV